MSRTLLIGGMIFGMLFSAAAWAGTGDSVNGNPSYAELDVFNAKNYWVRFKNKSDRDLYVRCKKGSKTSFIFLKSDRSRNKYLAKGKYQCKCANSRNGKSTKKFKLKVSKRTKSVSVGKKCGYR